MKLTANLGMVLEKQVFLACDWYAARAIALIQKVPTSWQPERRDGKIVGAHPEKKSTVDFLGTIGPDGRGIAFEAKEEESDRIKKSRVEPHQAKFLNMFARCGGLTFVMVSFYKLNRFFRIPYPAWESWQSSSVSVSDCEKIGDEIFLWDQNRRLGFLEGLVNGQS